MSLPNLSSRRFPPLLGTLLAVTLVVVTLVVVACSSPPKPVVAYGVGSTVAGVTLEDQFGVAHTLDDDVAMVLFARDMAGGGLIKAVLAEEPDALDRNRALYVADISGMPALIARLSAIPKMRERAYPTLLDRDGVATASFPAEKEKATVMRMSTREVTEIRYVASEAALRRVLGIAED